MKIGFFTDTYFPQISGVATSILTLKNELEKQGHQVYIFTTTDPNAKTIENGIIRMPSIPFISFKERRIVVRGMLYAYSIAKELQLDIVHTHTEFGVGILGKMIAKHMNIPCVHTYHTMYEDYLHYILKGKVIRPVHVRHLSRAFCKNMSGVICPSDRVVETLTAYGIKAPMDVISTGVDLTKFRQSEIQPLDLRAELDLPADSLLLLSLSRISYEKNIQGVIAGLPDIIKQKPNTHLVVVGNGPYLEKLQKMVEDLAITQHVHFLGEVDNQEVGKYYRAVDYFVSASSSESQGLTYIEAIASGTKCVVKGNEYLDGLFYDKALGVTFKEDKEFAATFLNYVGKTFENEEQIREKMLYDISSEAFGKHVAEFYQKSAKYYHEKCLVEELLPEKPKRKFSIKLFKRSK